MPMQESPFNDDISWNDYVISGTPPMPMKGRFSNGPALPLAPVEESMLPHDHSFMKTPSASVCFISGFNFHYLLTHVFIAMVCRVCLENVKKSAMLCETCSLIAHSKCAVNVPPTCDLHVLRFLYYAYHIRTHPTFSLRTLDIIMTSLWRHPTYDIILTSLWHHHSTMISSYSTTTSSLEHYKYALIS